MIDFAAAEEALLALLAPLRTNGVLCRALPDEAGAKGVADTYPAVVTVALAKISPVDRPSMDFKAQARSYEIVCDLRAKRLRGVAGIYSLPRQLEAAWQGQRVDGLERLEFVELEFPVTTMTPTVYLSNEILKAYALAPTSEGGLGLSNAAGHDSTSSAITNADFLAVSVAACLVRFSTSWV